MKPKLKMGMVGGGGDATIGVIHQMAARLDADCLPRFIPGRNSVMRPLQALGFVTEREKGSTRW